MNIIAGQFRSQSLLKIKKIVDLDENGDKFIICLLYTSPSPRDTT